MKYVIVIPEGASDLPLDDLGGKTPLQAAKTPNLDTLVELGRAGLVRTQSPALALSPATSMMSLLGYDPSRYFTGVAPLEAVGAGVNLPHDKTVFRFDFVTIMDEVLEDITAGSLSTPEAKALLEQLSAALKQAGIKLIQSQQYRNLVLFPGEWVVTTTSPYTFLSKRYNSYLPRSGSADVLLALMERVREFLAQSEINHVREDLGENTVTDAWIWGQGKRPTLSSFQARYNLKAFGISSSNYMRGLCSLLGWVQPVSPAYALELADVDYAAVGKAAVDALELHDIVTVHLEGATLASLAGNPAEKVSMIEQTDKHIIGPLLKSVRRGGQPWRMMVTPGIAAGCDSRNYLRDDVPVVIAGERMQHSVTGGFSEDIATNRGDLHIDRGDRLMEYFITVR